MTQRSHNKSCFTGRARLVEVTVIGDLATIRLFLCFACFIASAMMFWPGDTFDNPSYAVMKALAPERYWAVLYCVSGVAILYKLMYPQSSRALAVCGGLLVCALWSASTFAILLSTYPPLSALSTEVTIGAASWWHLVRLLAEGDGDGRPHN